MEWTKGAIPRNLAVPGVVEFRAYRPVSGAHQMIITYEFADLAAWAAFYDHKDIQQSLDEARGFTTDLTAELRGASPVVPEAIRPG